MDQLNQWLRELSHNYVLIVVAAVAFFGAKSIIGFVTYRRFNKQLEEIKTLVKKQK